MQVVADRPKPNLVQSIAVSVFVFLASALLLANVETSLLSDMLFVLVLVSMLVVHKSSVAGWYKFALYSLVLFIVMPWLGAQNAFYIDVITQIAMFAVLALGLNVVVGFAGLLDLGYVAFYAVGAYFWAILSTPQLTGISASLMPLGGSWFFLLLPAALLVGALAGILLGLPVLRLRGDYLAIVTLGFGEVIRVLANNLDRPVNITNGAQGITSISRPPLLLLDALHNACASRASDDALSKIIGCGLDDSRLYQIYFYILALVVLIIMLWFVHRLNVSRIGRAWTAIREDETAAIAMGIPLVCMKLMAFAVGASFASVMGMIFAAKQLYINPPTFDLIRSISILSMVILGGMGSIPGVILGAALVTMLNLQLLPRLTAEMGRLNLPPQFDPNQYQRMIFGLLLILMSIFRPEGILPEDRRRQELHENDATPGKGASGGAA